MNNNILAGSAIVSETGTSSNIENYKIAIIGNQHVGKTTILSRYKYETTDDTYAPTVGIDFLTKNVFLEDKTIRLIMWDTAGQERFKSLIPSYLKNANCVILTYDITDKSSFTSLNKWLSDVKDNVVGIGTLTYIDPNTKLYGALGHEILLIVIGLVVGAILGFVLSRLFMKKYLQKNPPINEQMIKIMMSQMGRTPTQKQINQMMKAMNNAK